MPSSPKRSFRRPQDRAARRRAERMRGGGTRFPVWLLGIGAVVVLGLIAVVATRSADDGSGQTAPADTEQTRPVEVAGEPLAELSQSGSDPAIGSRMPTLEGASFDDSPVTIGEDGTPKVIMFLAHWCPHCQNEVPVIQDWIEANGQPEGVELYSVTTATSPEKPNYPPSTWLADEDWPLPVLADDAEASAARALGLSGFPFFVAVDADGEVVARTGGEIGGEGLARLIEQAGGSV